MLCFDEKLKLTIIRDLPWYYAELLDWRQENGILKAFPKHRLSDSAHRVVSRAFRRLGGKFVSYRGRHYFELVLTGPRSVSTSTALKVKRAYEELQKET
jgi:hypothetical protein